MCFLRCSLPGSDRILTASWDKTARLWDLERKELAVLRGQKTSVSSAIFSPGGDRILTASEGQGRARLWDLQGKEVAILRGHEDLVGVPRCFSPGGDRILTCSEDKTARLWDLEGEELAVLRGHEGLGVGCAVLSRPVTASSPGRTTRPRAFGWSTRKMS